MYSEEVTRDMNPIYTENHFDLMVRHLTSRHITAWDETPESVPEFSMRFTDREQLENERRVELHLRKFPHSFTAYNDMQEKDQGQLRRRVKSAILRLPFFSQDFLDDQFFESSEKATGSFVHAAREFDSSITENEIHQALRNLWVFNSIQLMFGEPILCTPSSFAYSLLYPFTDNGLDNASRTEAEKKALLHWLTQWFERGECATPDDLTAKIARLLQMIEEQFPPSEFPDVHNSLFAIHCAQRKSLMLHDVLPDTDEPGLFAITVEKGGTSVLADGYLVKGQLSITQADILFAYGVLLQFVDDLQDLEEDGIAGHSNPFSRAMARGQLDNITCRLIHFGRSCAVMLDELESSNNGSIRRMIEGSCTFLIAEAVARQKEFYSRSFLQKFERATPFRVEYLAEMKRNMSTQNFQSVRCSVVENEFSLS